MTRKEKKLNAEETETKNILVKIKWKLIFSPLLIWNLQNGTDILFFNFVFLEQSIKFTLNRDHVRDGKDMVSDSLLPPSERVEPINKIVQIMWNWYHKILDYVELCNLVTFI